jgi:hypothetical protein
MAYALDETRHPRKVGCNQEILIIYVTNIIDTILLFFIVQQGLGCSEVGMISGIVMFLKKNTDICRISLE